MAQPTQPTQTPQEFAQKWGGNETKEKAVTKAAGGDGFADVWKKDFFGCAHKLGVQG